MRAIGVGEQTVRIDKNSHDRPCFAVAYQRTIAKRVQSSVFESGGQSLARHPLQLGWFTTQVSMYVPDTFRSMQTLLNGVHSCLHLWNYDRSMTEALEVAKMFLLPVDTLTTMFPCQGEAKRPLSSTPLTMFFQRWRWYEISYTNI